jgi:hypothetical protein
MDRYEREQVLEQLAVSEARVLSLVAGLTEGQWSFRETPERWSIAENVEHLAVFERFILGMIADRMQGQAEPGKTALAAAKEPLVMGLGSASARGTRLQAREAVQPLGRWPDRAELIAQLRTARAQTVAFAAATEANLREHFFAHIAFGDLDCCQWLLVVGQHGLRHALQIEEVMASEGYPAHDGRSGSMGTAMKMAPGAAGRN